MGFDFRVFILRRLEKLLDPNNKKFYD